MTRYAKKMSEGQFCPECGELLEKYGAPNSPEIGKCWQHGKFRLRKREVK
jgi:hypothetical protein